MSGQEKVHACLANLDATNMTTVLQTSPPGQDHDRFDHTNELGLRNVLPHKQDEMDGSSGTIPDITPFQKMLSATTGSLLTGLSSMCSVFAPLDRGGHKANCRQ